MTDGHPAAPPQAPPAPASPSRFGRVVRSLALAALFLLVASVFVAFILELPLPGLHARGEAKSTTAPPPLGVELVADAPNTLRVPEDVRVALGIRRGKQERVAAARVPTRTRPLVLPGSTALDPTRLMRIRARFAPAEVVQIGEAREFDKSSKEGRTVFRELRSGDHVRKGQVLGVFYSVDVGSKKNDLIDALVQEKLDEEVLERAEMAGRAGAVPEVFLLNARRNLESDRNAISRALNMLRVWNIPEEDIEAVYKEAREVLKNKVQRKLSKQERLDRVNRWARVELKAPDDGVIVERNVARHEMVVDNTVNLFQIAKVDRVLVVANAPEDDLPTLLKLRDDQRFWTVRTVNSPPGTGTRGPIDDIGYLIDVNQHTALVKGYIDNPGGRLRGGQFISATIQLPPPEDVVEVPMSAVVDDGKQCVVFVQPRAGEPRYTLRRVEVTHRFEKTAFVKSKLTAGEQGLTDEDRDNGLLPRRPLRPGERVLLAGVLELKKELEDRQAKAR
jgi:cobalt-zinc-cadmium efflux system membrane fusion protein